MQNKHDRNAVVKQEAPAVVFKKKKNPYTSFLEFIYPHLYFWLQ